MNHVNRTSSFNEFSHVTAHNGSLSTMQCSLWFSGSISAKVFYDAA